MVPIPDNVRDLFEKPFICALATIMPDGQPQVHPVWCDLDGEYIVVNTARGRQKDRNMSKRSKVTIFIVDPADDYHWVEARGHIADVSEEGANDVINRLSRKYTGHDYNNFVPGQVRVTYKITVDKVMVR